MRFNDYQERNAVPASLTVVRIYVSLSTATVSPCCHADKTTKNSKVL
jgi:hypothetical protein